MVKNLLETLRKRFFGIDNVIANNPQIEQFATLDKESENVIENSVIDQALDDAVSKVGYNSVNTYKSFVYGNVAADKPKRMTFYRQMSKFPEVADAIDEICDGAINFDSNHTFVNIIFQSELVEDEKQEILRKEFEKFISLFDFENNGYQYFKQLVTEGEITWENVIDNENKEEGIIGITTIPTECYEFLIDERYNIVGIIFNAQVAGKTNNGNSTDVDKELQTRGYNGMQASYQPRNNNVKVIIMPISQITHINTGDFNDSHEIVYPVLERARRSYRQLSLIEDAIIIYRLVRAPERLMFNVDTGKLPATKAEEMVFKLMKRYQSKKVYDPQSGTVMNGYDVHSMSENYWFPKPADSQGTSVTTIQGAQNLGQLDDLNYFLRKLYLSLKIPYDRFNNPTSQYYRSEQMNYEEYRFAKFIMRLQMNFSRGLALSFKTHLQLKGLWDEYKLTSRSFYIKFVPPTAFELYEQQRLLKIRLENYELLSSKEEFSKDLAMKEFLNYTDESIEENYAKITGEKIRLAKMELAIENARKEESEAEQVEAPSGSGGSDVSADGRVSPSEEEPSPSPEEPSPSSESPSTPPEGAEEAPPEEERAPAPLEMPELNPPE
jgi:hypothetical protein